MNVSLTPELEKIVQNKVASGLYTSASEVIREALRLMVEHDKVYQEKLAALRSDIDVGIRDLERGNSTEYNKKTSADLVKSIKNRPKK